MDLGSRFHTLGPLGLAFALQHANHEPFTLSSHLAAPSFPICKLFPAASDQLHSGNPSCVAGTWTFGICPASWLGLPMNLSKCLLKYHWWSNPHSWSLKPGKAGFAQLQPWNNMTWHDMTYLWTFPDFSVPHLYRQSGRVTRWPPDLALLWANASRGVNKNGTAKSQSLGDQKNKETMYKCWDFHMGSVWKYDVLPLNCHKFHCLITISPIIVASFGGDPPLNPLTDKPVLPCLTTTTTRYFAENKRDLWRCEVGVLKLFLI